MSNIVKLTKIITQWTAETMGQTCCREDKQHGPGNDVEVDIKKPGGKYQVNLNQRTAQAQELLNDQIATQIRAGISSATILKPIRFRNGNQVIDCALDILEEVSMHLFARRRVF